MSYDRYAAPALSLFPDAEQTAALKLRFADAWLRNPDNAFDAGRVIFGMDTARALFAAQTWVIDPDVLAERDRLIAEHGEEHFLPSKAVYGRKVWELANDRSVPIEDRFKYHSLYGDIRGFKADKSGPAVVINQNRIMVVKDHGSDEDWEAKAAAQQHRLSQQGKAAVIDVQATVIGA